MENSKPQGSLGNLLENMMESKTNADIVFCIDATESMTPIIETIKSYALTLYDDLVEGLKAWSKKINQCRIKVIVFRDYYCDGPYAMEQSDFFYLPDENNAFKEFVSRIEAKGGGDEPENGLEALGLAMRSDWVKEGTSKRHIIVLFTDASAHSLEDERRSQVENYPDNMFNTYDEMLEAWNGEEQGTCMDTDARIKVDQSAKRLILFAPDSDVWTNIATDFEQTMMLPTILADGCSEVDKDMIINSLSRSTK